MGSHCRGCRAAIRWAFTESGKRICLDFDPVPNGTIVLDETERCPTARVLTSAKLQKLRDAGTKLFYRAHFASCPKAAEFR